jgi:hypothetical protein
MDKAGCLWNIHGLWCFLCLHSILCEVYVSLSEFIQLYTGSGATWRTFGMGSAHQTVKRPAGETFIQVHAHNCTTSRNYAIYFFQETTNLSLSHTKRDAQYLLEMKCCMNSTGSHFCDDGLCLVHFGMTQNCILHSAFHTTVYYVGDCHFAQVKPMDVGFSPTWWPEIVLMRFPCVKHNVYWWSRRCGTVWRRDRAWHFSQRLSRCWSMQWQRAG